MSEESKVGTVRKPGKKPGTPRTPGSGRKKGTPNRNSLTLRSALHDAGFDLVSELVAALEDAPKEYRFDKLLQLVKYVYPALKEVDPTTLPSEASADPTSIENMPSDALMLMMKPRN